MLAVARLVNRRRLGVTDARATRDEETKFSVGLGFSMFNCMCFACPADPFVLPRLGGTVLFSKSSAHSAGPLRPCGLAAFCPWLVALRLLVLFLLLLVLPLPLLLLWLLRLLNVLLYLLLLLLRLPLFWLAGSANMDPRRSQNRPPGNGLLEASGGLLPKAGPKWPPGGSWTRGLHGRLFWEVFLEVCPGRLKNQRCFDVLQTIACVSGA